MSHLSAFFKGQYGSADALSTIAAEGALDELDVRITQAAETLRTLCYISDDNTIDVNVMQTMVSAAMCLLNVASPSLDALERYLAHQRAGERLTNAETAAVAQERQGTAPRIETPACTCPR